MFINRGFLNYFIGEFMKQKGQVAIEFIFILLIIIVYIFTVTKPLIDGAGDIVNDIERISRINNETEKISKLINNTQLLGIGTKNTINIFVPDQSTINCYDDTNKIGFSTKINVTGLNPELNLCPDNNCDRNISLFNEIHLDCGVAKLNTGNYKLKIEKTEENKIKIEIE